MTSHAKLSPSGAERWMVCPGSVALEDGLPDEDSEYSKDGTAAHEMAQLVLDSGASDADRYIGRRASNGVEMTEDMASNVMIYASNVRDYAKGNELMVEQRLSIAHLTGEPEAKGTSDVVILTADELQVHDLKYGKGIRKDAEQNKQLMIYALAALREFEMLGDFKRVRLVIHQPRLDHLSEWDISVDELNVFGDTVTKAAGVCDMAVTQFVSRGELHPDFLLPGEEQCRFCKAKATCPSLRDFVLDKVVGESFDDLTQPLAPVVAEHSKDEITDNGLLANLLGAVDLIETWCKAIRGRADGELRAGHEVPGYKLVQGRKGARAWSSDAEAEALLKSMRLPVDDMYVKKVIPPTKAEELLAKDKPKCWKRIAHLITQAEGGLSVAPASDKRPAVVVQVEEFHDEEALEGLV